MSAPKFIVTDLSDWDDVNGFTCGVPELDLWLQESAKRAQKVGTVKVKLLRPLEGNAFIGYYAICPTEVRRDEDPLSSRVRGAMTRVPGFMLAKLAIASDVQGQHLGRDLLVDAIRHICDASELVGGRIIVVDPISEPAAAFYAHYGFARINGSDRMYLLVDDARASLQE